ncbi:hypothetical protein ACHAQG_005906 [Verticillium nonalfalfae]
MNFDSLAADIQALPFLTTPQRKAISRLLSDVKKNSSRPIRVSKDTTVRHMDPGVRQLDIPPSKDSPDNHTTPTPVTWLCIPYFSLERYSGFSASTNPGSYPTQTLLQASYARIAYKRDMQQAARHINSGDRGWCFHIPQLWCLVIGDSVLVTCGLMDELTLRDKAISIQEEIPRPPHSKGVKGARILVSSWAEQLSFAISLIQSGMAETIDSLSSFRLAGKVTVLPMDLISLMSIRLLSDVTGKHPSASETYLEYLQGLEAQITSMPSDRSYETRINHVQEEITIAKNIVGAQKVIYGFISRTLNAGESKNLISRTRPFDHYGEGLNRSAAPYNNPFAPGNADDMALELPLSDLSSVRDLLVWECIDLLERKKKEFQGYGLHAQSLERQNASKVIGTKDKQEQAIYIFTLVTIIFLPLSAVSSIFGMNTSDVRDMESGMWTYWAVAIPVTLLVILLGLWWLGELGALAAWVTCKLRGQRGLSDEIPPPPYPGHQLSSMTVPEELPGRTRNVYRERYYRPPPPVIESDDDGRDGWRRSYRQREDERLEDERYAVQTRLDRERRRAEERQLLEEKRLLDKLEAEEEAKAKMQAELDLLRREMRMQEEEAAKRAAGERMQRHRNEERERRLAEEKARRAAEEKVKRAAEEKQPASEREKRDDSDAGPSRRAPHRDQTVEEYD